MQHLKDTRNLILFCSIFLAAAAAYPATDSPVAHQEASCSPCHKTAGITSEAFSTPVNNKCLECHKFNQISSSAFHESPSGSCVACHNFHEPSQITVAVDGAALELNMEADVGHCQACHDSRGSLSNLSPGHKVAASLYHAEAAQLEKTTPSEACLRCHSNTSNSNWQTTTNEKISFNAHASHPLGIKVVAGKGNSTNWIRADIDPRLPLFEGTIECQTCHLLTADSDHLMIPFPSKYDLCKGCHMHYGDDKYRPADMTAAFVKN